MTPNYFKVVIIITLLISTFLLYTYVSKNTESNYTNFYTSEENDYYYKSLKPKFKNDDETVKIFFDSIRNKEKRNVKLMIDIKNDNFPNSVANRWNEVFERFWNSVEGKSFTEVRIEYKKNNEEKCDLVFAKLNDSENSFCFGNNHFNIRSGYVKP